MHEQTKYFTPTITFWHSVSVLRQLNIHTNPVQPANTMLAKLQVDNTEAPSFPKLSRIEQLKTTTKFLACGLPGHWYKENPRYLRIIQNIPRTKSNVNEGLPRNYDNMENHFSSTGSVADSHSNPIIYHCYHTSMVGIINVTLFCDRIGIPVLIVNLKRHSCMDGGSLVQTRNQW